MRERSKDAARCRREKENAELAELSRLLPLPHAVTAQLDKASIIRLTTSYLKMRQLFPKGLGVEWGDSSCSSLDVMMPPELSSQHLQSLDGFVFVLSADAKIIYVSETASVHLGFSQVELTGNSIFDFIHGSDDEEMKALLSYQQPVTPLKFINEDIEVARSFCLRMKCILAKRNAGLVSDGYKVIHCRGYLKLRSGLYTSSDDPASASFRYQVTGLVALGQPLPCTAITEIKMSSYTFMFRAGLDMTLIYLDTKVLPLTGYEPQHLIDKSLYKFVHPDDCLKMRQDHYTLLMKGQVITGYYRFLSRSGGWIWIQSLCTIVHNNRTSWQRCILVLNYVLSERDHPEVLLDREQMQEPKSSNCNNSTSAKRSRISSKSVDNAIPELKINTLSYNPSLNGIPVHAGNSQAIRTKNASPNEAFGYSTAFNSNPKDPQLQSALTEFDQIMKSYPAVYDCSESKSSANLPSLVPNMCHNLKLEDSLNNFNCPPSFPNYGINTNYHSSCYDSPNSTSIYSGPLNSPKLSIPDEEPASSANNSIPPPSVYSRDIAKYFSPCGNSNIADDKDELPYYVEKIDKGPLEYIHKRDAVNEVSSVIPNPNNGYLIPSGDFNSDICPSRDSFDIKSRHLVEISGDSTYETISSDLHLRKPDSEEAEYHVADTESPQSLFACLSNQNLSMSSSESPLGMHSSASSVYFSELNNFIPDVKYPLYQGNYQPTASVSGRTILFSLNDRRKCFDTSLNVSNEKEYAMDKASPFNTHCDSKPLSHEHFSPSSFFGEMSSSRDLDREQKHLTMFHLSFPTPSEYSSGFCDYASQCTLYSPGISDSFSDLKSGANDDNEKTEAVEFRSSPKYA